MSIGTILLVILILLLVGVVPVWPHAQAWGYGPSGVVGVILIVVLIMLLLGALPVISGYLLGDRKLVAQLEALPDSVHADVARTVDLLGLRLIHDVVRNKLSGQVLKRRTGRLAASIARGAPDTRSRFEQTQTSATSIVGTNVSYGKTWELGAHIPAYTILPVKAKALRFMIGGQVRFAKRVNMPAREVGARPYLAPALQEMKPLIITELQATLKRSAEKGLKP